MPVFDRALLPIGTDIEVFDPETVNDPPVYSGGPEDAFMTLMPGLYPFVIDNDEDDDLPLAWLLIVTPGESFAVSTDVEYGAISPLVED